MKAYRFFFFVFYDRSWEAHRNKAKFLHTKLQGDIVEALDGRERAIEQVKAVNHSVDHWKAVSLDRCVGCVKREKWRN